MAVTPSSVAGRHMNAKLVSRKLFISLRWRHNGRDSVWNYQPHDCLLNRWFRRRSKKTSQLRVTGVCVGNSPGVGEFPVQKASNAEIFSIWWRHHILLKFFMDIVSLTSSYCTSSLSCAVIRAISWYIGQWISEKNDANIWNRYYISIPINNGI